MSTSSSIQTKFEPHDPQPNDENNISQQNILESAMGSSLLSGSTSEPNGIGNSNSFINNAGSQEQEQETVDKANEGESYLREQDRFLPIANVSRIMKKAVPPIGKIAKDAKECVQECVSEFISFITSEASDRCQQEKRKTINGEDILFAMNALGFDNYVEPLKIYLQKYREWVKQGEKSLIQVKGEMADQEEQRARALHEQVHYVGSLPQSMLSNVGDNTTHQLYATHFQNNLSQFS